MLNCRTVEGEKEGSSKAAEAAKSAPSTNISRPTNGTDTCHQGPLAIGFKGYKLFHACRELNSYDSTRASIADKDMDE